LCDVIAADRVGFADQHQCRRLHVAQAVRPFEVVARDAKVNELRQLGVRRPGELEKCFYFVAMAFAILSGKESIRIDDFVVNKFLEAHFHHVEHQTMRQARNTIRAGSRRRARTTCRHYQTLHATGKVLCQRKRYPAAHRMADQMSRGKLQMIHQSDDIERHLLDRVNALGRHRTAAAARIVKDNIE